MITTISPKYQIVIPKAVRIQLNIKPGQKMKVEATSDGSIIVKSFNEFIGFDELTKYAGSLDTAKTAWGKQGIDVATWVRRQRDEEWR
jgi:AbrB family looped-hinge helix DNA binding protein